MVERKEQILLKPYVVSGDIVPLLNKWANQKGFILPSTEFFNQLRGEFIEYMRRIFPEFEFVPEKEITKGIARLVSESGLTPVSLDRVYYPTNPSLDIARLVDKDGKDRGLGHRPGTPPLLQQFKRLKETGLKEIVLVDDVIFTGDLIERVIQCLSRLGIQVLLVCAGIGIAEGINRIKIIKDMKREIRCVRTYEEVIDEVCERDFYPGVPLSGRVLLGEENVGVPYILPWGNPRKWASIPSGWQTPFSKFCIEQTIRLFEEIEKCSNRMVSCTELGRMVPGLPRDRTRFVDALRSLF
ncbi:MAG: hypothetical protein DDT18_01816 [Actinobacteria bacterium]|nr:hypothetical protein [Actinomycetota bacterium]